MMAIKRSFRDPVTGILNAWGYMASNRPDDIVQEELDDFTPDLLAHKWQWDGLKWRDVTPTPLTLVQRAQDLYFEKSPDAALDRAMTLALLDELNELRAFVSLPVRTQDDLSQRIQAKITPDAVARTSELGFLARIKQFFTR